MNVRLIQLGRQSGLIRLLTWSLGLLMTVALATAQAKSSTSTVKKSAAKAQTRAAAPAVRSQSATKAGAAVSRQVRPASARVAVAQNASKAAPRSSRVTAARAAPAVMSVGYLTGLHATTDPLALKSGAVLVIDRDSKKVLLSKNPEAVLPIASITKLMTALVVVEAGQSMDELIQIEAIDADETMNRRSRLIAGTSLPRSEMLRLALMSSENRAAFALSRHFPGGAGAFVMAMNRKAEALQMKDTRFVEATGLSADNRSSAHDLARLVTAASAHALIRDYSTAQESLVPVGSRERTTQFRSTNGLIKNPEWDISLQKTGYIAAAGRCLVMQASLAGRKLTMVLLDSAGKYSGFGDAERIRQWLLKEPTALVTSAPVHSVIEAAF
jgi:serine-type D-Ala-D-Ala endopeptidase (penicillin-binding protein 7)